MIKDALPDKVSFAELRDRARSTKDVNEMIRRLDLYRGEGFDLVANPYGEGFISRAQLEIAEREAAAENRRRQRALKLAARGAEQEGRLPTDMTSALRPVDAGMYTTNTIDPLSTIMNGRSIDQRTTAWQANYVSMLQTIQDTLWVRGMSDDAREEANDRIEDIISMVNSLSPEQYYYAQLVFPQVGISILSDVELTLRGLAEMQGVWQHFVSSI